MATERERKFLVTDNSWKDVAGTPVRMIQGYISHNPDNIVRVFAHEEKAFIVIENGFQYQIPMVDAREMLEHHCKPEGFSQGRLADNVTVRVRTAETEAFLTIKGKAPEDDPEATPEYEYKIPVSDAEALMKNFCEEKELVHKKRHHVEYAGRTWEVDVFLRENTGLIVAEIEFDEKNAHIDKPSWAGREVTKEKRYKNARLSKEPFNSWSKKDQKNALKPG